LLFGGGEKRKPELQRKNTEYLRARERERDEMSSSIHGVNASDDEDDDDVALPLPRSRCFDFLEPCRRGEGPFSLSLLRVEKKV